MQTIQRRDSGVHNAHPKHNILTEAAIACVCYLDTVEMFVRNWPRAVSVIASIQEVRVEKCRDRRGEVCGYRIIVHQPTKRTLRLLEQMREAQKGALCRFDVAFDFVGPNAERLKEWLAKHMVMKWRRDGFMLDIDGTTYWVEQARRNQRSARDVALYADRLSKVTGDECCHFDLRFQRAQSCRQAGYHAITDLLSVNPAELFSKYLRLVDFDIEPLIQRLQRAAVNADRERYNGIATSQFIDRWRAAIPAKVRSIVERASSGRAQMLHGWAGFEVTSISHDVLNIPHVLVWYDNHNIPIIDRKKRASSMTPTDNLPITDGSEHAPS